MALRQASQGGCAGSHSLRGLYVAAYQEPAAQSPQSNPEPYLEV